MNGTIINWATITGKAIGNFTFSHETAGERFYKIYVSAMRTNGKTADIIPITVSEGLVDVTEEWDGHIVKVFGPFRSHNHHGKDNKTHLILSVFAKEFLEIEEPKDANKIFLCGYICKGTNYRNTPLGREICDILIATNCPDGKSDYIPCIAWGGNARAAESFKPGDCIKIGGHIQSREYEKKLSETESETRTAYEVSIDRIELLEKPELKEQEGL